MWITNLEGFYFSGRIDGDEHRLFLFNGESGEFEPVLSGAGDGFVPYSDAVELFGTTLISGLVTGQGDLTIGYEIYEILEDNTVGLWADVYPGVDSSFVEVDEAFTIGGADDFVLVNAGVSSNEHLMVINSHGLSIRFADLFDGLDTLESINDPLEFQGQTYFLGDPNGGTKIAWTFSQDGSTLSPLVEFDQEVGTFRFMDLMQSEDSLFASIVTGIHGRELWQLNEDGVWELTSNLSPGNSWSGATFAFDFNGNEYVWGTTIPLGRELYRVDADGDLELVADILPGVNSFGLGFVRHFKYDGAMYLASVLVDDLYRLTEDGTVEQVEGLIEGQADSIPRVFVNLDEQSGSGYVSGAVSSNSVYVALHGEIHVLQLPEGDAFFHGFHGEQALVELRHPGGTFTLYLITDDLEVLSLYTGETSGGLIFSSLLTDPERSRDVFLGDETSETVTAVSGGAIILAEGGDDLLMGSADRDEIYGGAGNDTIFGGAGGDDLFGGSGDDVIDTGDVASAVDGFDFVMPGEGNDSVTGHGGGSVISYEDLDFAVTVDVSAGTTVDTATNGDAKSDSFTSIDGVIGTDHDDSLIGSDDDDRLVGGIGNDTLSGGDGSDTIFGGDGDDTIDGDSGIDTADFSGSANGVSVTLSEGATDGGATGEGTDVIRDIEIVIGSDSDDTITGNSEANTLDGGTGDDTIDGGTGNDSIIGDIGNDTIRGERGDDSISGGDGDDDIKGGIGNDTIYGGDGGDDIAGGRDNDILYGGEGVTRSSAKADRTNYMAARNGTS